MAVFTLSVKIHDNMIMLNYPAETTLLEVLFCFHYRVSGKTIVLLRSSDRRCFDSCPTKQFGNRSDQWTLGTKICDTDEEQHSPADGIKRVFESIDRKDRQFNHTNTDKHYSGNSLHRHFIPFSAK